LLREITVARIVWLSQSEERKNSAKPKKWPSMIRNVSLVNGQTDRLALPYIKLYLLYETPKCVCTAKALKTLILHRAKIQPVQCWNQRVKL
jgi:hypothetical protein